MNLKQKLNLYRRYPFWAAKHCIFIHIPKSAGTSINHALYGRTLGHYRATDIADRFPALYKRSFVFAIVRNPWDLVLSAYRFARQGRTPFMGMRNPEKYQLPQFDTFERFVLEWLPKRDLRTSDIVFQPQCDFILDSAGDQVVDFVGRVETLMDDMRQVESHLGYSIDVPHINRTGAVGAYRDAYTNTTMIDVVDRVYRKDVRQFHYAF